MYYSHLYSFFGFPPASGVITSALQGCHYSGSRRHDQKRQESRQIWKAGVEQKGTPKIDRMLYNGCEIVEDTQCCQHITITMWHWHLPNLESFFPSPITQIYFFYSPVTSHIFSHTGSNFTNICKYRSILSTANCPCVWLKIASQSELSYFLDGSKNRFNSLKKVDRLSQVLKIGTALSHIYNLHYKLLNKVNRLLQSVSHDYWRL